MAKTFLKYRKIAENAVQGYKIRFRYKECIEKVSRHDIHTYIHTYIQTLLHSAPLGALPPYMNIKISSYKEKKNYLQIKYGFKKNSLHFDNTRK